MGLTAYWILSTLQFDKKGRCFFLYREKQKGISTFRLYRGHPFYANFGHLYGFPAAYYPFLWAEVIAADILKQFDKQGMRNRQFFERYHHEKLLTTGCSPGANQFVAHFLSRPFNFDAFIECLNGAS